jgi:hypothetical protein
MPIPANGHRLITGNNREAPGIDRIAHWLSGRKLLPNRR